MRPLYFNCWHEAWQSNVTPHPTRACPHPAHGVGGPIWSWAQGPPRTGPATDDSSQPAPELSHWSMLKRPSAALNCSLGRSSPQVAADNVCGPTSATMRERASCALQCSPPPTQAADTKARCLMCGSCASIAARILAKATPLAAGSKGQHTQNKRMHQQRNNSTGHPRTTEARCYTTVYEGWCYTERAQWEVNRQPWVRAWPNYLTVVGICQAPSCVT